MVATIRFKGGPLGGETRAYPVDGARIKVAALSYPTGASSGEGYASMVHTVEEYSLVPIGEAEYAAHWIYPLEGLLQKIHKLERRVDELQQIEDVTEALHTLRDFLNR